MKTIRWLVLAMLLAAFIGVPSHGYADAAAQSQSQPGPSIEPAPGAPPTNAAPNPAPMSSGLFGLSMTQVWILVGVSVVFIVTAILMRWWLEEPATPEEAEAPPIPGPQDLPQ